MEMAKTAAEAQKLTATAEGKHHIGDFLPPEELSKFMDKYKVNNRTWRRLIEKIPCSVSA
jgi:splicing factor 4